MRMCDQSLDIISDKYEKTLEELESKVKVLKYEGELEEKIMNELEYYLVENKLTAEDFIRLKVATGFMERPIEQVEKALANDLFDVTVVYNGEVIGMGRLVGDGYMYRPAVFVSLCQAFNCDHVLAFLFFIGVDNAIRDRFTHRRFNIRKFDEGWI